MSSLIEKAARRLEQLRQAGVDGVAQHAQAGSAAQPSNLQGPEPVAPVSRLATIDLERLSAAGYVTPDAPRTTIADQFRVIKRPLLANATGKGSSEVANGNLIMVTSSLPGEGKSFTAINLAMSMAMELDHRVLLVDADVARPSLMGTLGLPPSPGLLDLLLKDGVQMSTVLLRTNVEKLTFLPSGTPHPRATELLASDAMTALIEDLGSRYADRIVIFDSPPLLQTTEARVLAAHMGQIVMVVQAEKTLESQLRHALSTIESCPIKLMLLNQARSGGQESYGYGYGYGQMSGFPEIPSAAVSA
jgi:exopolysaccharide/PEP-CTERM locus tyrosine autokinase